VTRLPLHALDPGKALQDRWAEGVRRYRGGDGSRPFVGDAVEEAYAELLDFTLYLREAQRQRALPLPFIRESEVHVRRMVDRFRRFLVARDAGGVVPLDHPAARYVNE
jgi:hypothetical protein